MPVCGTVRARPLVQPLSDLWQSSSSSMICSGSPPSSRARHRWANEGCALTWPLNNPHLSAIHGAVDGICQG